VFSASATDQDENIVDVEMDDDGGGEGAQSLDAKRD
jgi:hypothetical protein